MIGLDRWTALAPRQREGGRERRRVGEGCIEWGRDGRTVEGEEV